MREWHALLTELGIKVLPWAVDTSNATLTHEKIYPNSIAFIAESVAIADHVGFQGWHIDYEDEHPSDKYPHKSEGLAKFLPEFANALHAKDMELFFDVAGWSGLISKYSSVTSSTVDEFQNMVFYARPGSYKSDPTSYYSQVRVADPKNWANRAGVGIGICYDGCNGYPQEWTETIAQAFVAEFVAHGGQSLNIFRLSRNGVNDWPYSDWWWTILDEFAAGRSSEGII